MFTCAHCFNLRLSILCVHTHTNCLREPTCLTFLQKDTILAETYFQQMKLNKTKAVSAFTTIAVISTHEVKHGFTVEIYAFD